METIQTCDPDLQSPPELASAIDRWLAARGEYQKHASDKTQHAYNTTYYALGEAWAHQYPEAVNTPGAFEWFRLGLIALQAHFQKHAPRRWA